MTDQTAPPTRLRGTEIPHQAGLTKPAAWHCDSSPRFRRCQIHTKPVPKYGTHQAGTPSRRCGTKIPHQTAPPSRHRGRESPQQTAITKPVHKNVPPNRQRGTEIPHQAGTASNFPHHFTSRPLTSKSEMKSYLSLVFHYCLLPPLSEINSQLVSQ